MRRIILLLLGALLFAGCAGSIGVDRDESCSDELYDARWRVVMIDNDPVFLKRAPFIRFTRDGRVGGFSGCNSFFGEALISETAIDFAKIGSTRRFCAGVEGEIEHRLFSIFKGVKWWQFDEEGDLVIFDDEHRLILEKSAE